MDESGTGSNLEGVGMIMKLARVAMGCGLVATIATSAGASNGTGMTESSLVMRYAPVVVFHAEEQYFPVSLHGDDGMVCNNHENYDSDVAQGGLLALGENAGSQGWDRDDDGFPDEYVCYYCVQDLFMSYPLSRAGRYHVIQYWYYYAYNPPWSGLSMTAHEHDFETISVWVDWGTGTIARVVASEHLWHNMVTWPSSPVSVYVNLGGHGMRLSPELDFKKGLQLEPTDFVYVPLDSLAVTGNRDLDSCGHLLSGCSGPDFSADTSFFLEQGKAPWRQVRYRSPAESLEQLGIVCASGTETWGYRSTRSHRCRLIGATDTLHRELYPSGHTVSEGFCPSSYGLLVAFAGSHSDELAKHQLFERDKTGAILSHQWGSADAFTLHRIGQIYGWGLATGFCTAGSPALFPGQAHCFYADEKGKEVSAIMLALAHSDNCGLVLGGVLHVVPECCQLESTEPLRWEAGWLYETGDYELSCTAQSTGESDEASYVRDNESAVSLRLAGARHFPIGEIADIRVGGRITQLPGRLPLFGVDARLWWYGFLSLGGGYQWVEGEPMMPVYGIGTRVGGFNLNFTGGREQSGSPWYHLALECRM